MSSDRWPLSLQTLLVAAAATAAVVFTITPRKHSPRRMASNGIENAPTSESKKKLQLVYPADLHGEGKYVTLPMGRVRYWLIGPEDGKKVVLICGLSIPTIIFRDLAKILSNSGFRVLLYDLYGRGYSDEPDVDYNADLYITQLALLMQYIGWDKAYVAGLSMGGGIAAAFTAKFPHLVDGRVAFMASVGAMEPNRYFNFLAMPLASWIGDRVVRNRLVTQKAPVGQDVLQEVVRLQAAVLPNYIKAIRSSFVCGPIRYQEPSFKELGSRLIRVFLIWGTEDTIVHPRYVSVLKGFMPQAEILMIEGAGHDFTHSHPEKAAEALARFFG